MTEKRELQLSKIHRPVLGLVLWVPLNLGWFWATYNYSNLFPYVWIGKVEVGQILLKLSMLIIIPMILLSIKGDPWQSWGFRLKSWRQDLRLFLILAAPVIVAILLYRLLGAYYLVRPSGGLQALGALPLTFIIMFFNSGLPEEVFYRAYLQGHLAALLRSRLNTILLGALLFGLMHILHWEFHGVEGLSRAFAYAMLNQVSIGIVFAVLWERTRSLFPLALLHALVNAIAFM